MKTVFITGANKGLGFETAKYLLENGYFVYLGARKKELGTAAVNNLKTLGLNNCELVEIDTANEASVHKAKEHLSTRLLSLDVLINNAGILGRIPTAENPLSLNDIHEVFNTNLFGTISVTLALLPLLKLSEHPRIVNVTSDLASLTLHQDPAWKYYPFKGFAYGPSKSAINAFTIALAFQLRDTKFKVNCVTPGHTATDFNNYRGEKKPQDSCKTIARYAMLDDDAQTGKFFDEHGELPW
jgi:NAD(P)-dependent dehydrogenase (short-subunit alcohol dehydrogenase family)